ncbi:MAG: family 16 glycoside hydrolase [Verrucomicrobiota bacterium]
MNTPAFRIVSLTLGFAIGILPISSALDTDIYRTWTNREGKSIEARLKTKSDENVTLILRNGKSYDVALANLSQTDIEWLDSQKASDAQASLDEAGLMIQPLMTKPGNLIFEDTLAEKTEGWKAANGQWEVVDGALQGMELEADDHAATYKRKINFQNAIIQYSFKINGARATTLSVNDDVDHVCRVLFNERGLSTQKDDHDHGGPDTAVKFTTHEMTFDPEKWHTVLIEIHGDTLLAQVDDEDHVSFGAHELIAEVEKASIGFTIAGESVSFRNLKIWDAHPNEGWESTRKRLERKLD